MGSGSCDPSSRPAGKSDAADGSRGLVFLPSRARQVAASHALNREHRRPLHQHRAAFQLIGIWLERFRELAHVRADQVIGDNILEQIKPEQRNLRKDFSFAWNAAAEHMIECRDAVVATSSNASPIA
jgi:hypothetical protein